MDLETEVAAMQLRGCSRREIVAALSRAGHDPREIEDRFDENLAADYRDYRASRRRARIFGLVCMLAGAGANVWLFAAFDAVPLEAAGRSDSCR